MVFMFCITKSSKASSSVKENETLSAMDSTNARLSKTGSAIETLAAFEIDHLASFITRTEMDKYLMKVSNIDKIIFKILFGVYYNRTVKISG